MTATPKRRGQAIDASRREEARRLFETTALTQVEIAARLGLLAPSLSRMANREGWVRPKTEKRERTVRRIRQRVEREIDTIEAALAGTRSIDETDRAARTLASLVRTLRELQKYDEDAARRRGADDEDEDGAPADLDALRDALADRLDRLQRGAA
ncbi:MAG: hypothetical protein ABW275_03010 [Hansschlegelia sp.]